MNKLFLFFLVFVFLNACQAAKDGLTQQKRSNADEFLVEKKNPLVLPPSFGDLPTPDDNKIKQQNNNETNDSGSKYVAWCWKGNGGTTSSNSDGSITSTVQANTDAGFSIIQYDGTGAAATIGHGLGVAPELIITKQRTTCPWHHF